MSGILRSFEIEEFRIFPVLTGNEFIRTDLALTIYLDNDGNVYRIQNEGTEAIYVK